MLARWLGLTLGTSLGLLALSASGPARAQDAPRRTTSGLIDPFAGAAPTRAHPERIDDLIDPFASLPAPRHAATVRGLIDPFDAHGRALPEIVDPWAT